MKGLNDMEFGIGHIVRVKSGCISMKLVGVTGVVREKHKSLWNSEGIYIIEVPESVATNRIILETGERINGITMEYKDLELVLDEYATKENEQLLTTLVNQRTNDKYNTWEVRIRPLTGDRDTTYAELYINGRYEGVEFVNRYYTDEYNAGIACVEVCKRLFGVKDTKEKEEKASMPKYYTGKIVCISDNKYFTKGKLYKVENGAIYSDEGVKFVRFESLDQLNDYFKQLEDFSVSEASNFIEFVE